jgi:hypothetical protein
VRANVAVHQRHAPVSAASVQNTSNVAAARNCFNDDSATVEEFDIFMTDAAETALIPPTCFLDVH